MKKFNFIFYIFAFIGAGMLIGALFVLKSELAFVKSGVETTGTIIDLSVDRSSDNKETYFPIIQFNTADNREITFRSSTGSSSYRNSIGDNVEVIYLANNPKKAAINTYFGRYGASTILGIFAVIFSMIGFIPLIFIRRKNNKNQRVKRDGTPITVKITDVMQSQHVRINNSSPYQIIADYHDKLNNRVIRYKSDYIFFDPSPYIENQLVTIYLDKRNPKVYFMDISFLPTLID